MDEVATGSGFETALERLYLDMLFDLAKSPFSFPSD
jgi:hypothetical protein